MPLSEVASAVVSAKSTSTVYQSKSASEYMSELGLDDDVEEDIQQEMEVAKEAWAGIVSATNGNMTLDGSLILEERMNADGSVNVNEDDDDNDGVLCRLVTALGTTYSEEEHGQTLRSLACVVNGSDISSTGNVSERRELSEDAFIGWYIALLFDDNDDDEEDDVNSSEDGDGGRGIGTAPNTNPTALTPVLLLVPVLIPVLPPAATVLDGAANVKPAIGATTAPDDESNTDTDLFTLSTPATTPTPSLAPTLPPPPPPPNVKPPRPIPLTLLFTTLPEATTGTDALIQAETAVLTGAFTLPNIETEVETGKLKPFELIPLTDSNPVPLTLPAPAPAPLPADEDITALTSSSTIPLPDPSNDA